MSLEQSIADLKTSVDALNENLLKNIANSNKLIELAQGASEKAAAAKTTTKGKTEAEKPADPKPAETKTEAASTGGALTLDDLKNAIRGYAVPIPEDADEKTKARLTREKEARAAKIDELYGKVGAKNYKEVPADKYKAFINSVNKLIEAGNLTPDDEPKADDAGGIDDLL